MYQPKIREDQVETLYRLGVQMKKPMTHLIRQAVDKYVEKFNLNLLRREAHEPRTFRKTL